MSIDGQCEEVGAVAGVVEGCAMVKRGICNSCRYFHGYSMRNKGVCVKNEVDFDVGGGDGGAGAKEGNGIDEIKDL